MKTDKEYPATHSMSTAWYAVDVDGNVALMNYNEEGPVPQGCPEYFLERLAFELNHDDSTFPTAKFSDEQISEIIAGVQKCDFYERSDFFIVEVRNDFLQEFMQKMSNLDEDETIVRLSPTSNMFCVCFLYDDNTYGLMEEIYKQGGIVNSYSVDYWISDDWDDKTDSIKWNFRFSKTPFFVYAQPYWTGDLMARLIVPENPVKITQMPEKIQRSATCIPVRFCNTEKLQIAEYTAFDMHSCSDADIIESKEYYTLPTLEGVEKRICSTSLPKSALISCNECKLCNLPHLVYYNDKAHPFEFTNEPTVLIVATIKNHDSIYCYEENRGVKYISKSAIIYLTHGYFFNLMEGEAKDDVVKDMFKNCRVHFENTLSTINPNVIVVRDNAVDILTSIYPLSNHTINVNGTIYPCFTESEVGDNLDCINDLADKPYRGSKLERPIIEIEEVANDD